MAEQSKDYYTSDFRYSGGMNYDDFILAIPKGDVTNALNVFTVNTGGGFDNVVTPANGNILSFTLPIISAQNKIYQFSITSPYPEDNTYSINFLNLNYSFIAGNGVTAPNVTYTTTGGISTDAAAFKAAILASLATVPFTNTCTYTISGNTATFTLELTGLLGFDWLLVDNPILVITDSGNSFTGFSDDDTITDQTTGQLLGTILSVSTGTLILQNITGNNINPTDILVNQSATTVTLTAGLGVFSVPTNPIIVKEAIDIGLTDFSNGACLPIGGIDYLNDLFIFSTCQGNPPQTFTITDVTQYIDNILITISGDYAALFAAGESVAVSGVEGVPANGTWSVQSSGYSGGNTTVLLYSTIFSGSYTGGGTISLYNEGFLNISVHQKDLNSGTWTNTSLLSTKALNNRFYYPLRKEIVANKNNDILAIYFIDGNDYDRIFKYTGAYITNGAIEYYNPLGFYTYDSLALATRNINNAPTSIVKIFSVIDSGGAVPSGNWRFTVIPKDSSLTAGQMSIFSNPVNIYNGSFSAPADILGTPGAVSSMQITVQVSEIPVNVWSYMDLIGINYVGITETAYLIKEVPVPQDATTINITYTGLETLIPYTAGFVFPSLGYVNSGTQTVCSNTLVKADLTAAEINDYSAFFQQWTHVLNRNTTILQPTGDDRTGYTLGEYQVPLATSQSVSAMLNETYRMGAVVESLSGIFTPVFWIDDIRFDLNTSNVANPFGDAARRTGNNIPNYDLSESSYSTNTENVNSYVFYATFSPPIGWQNYLVGGLPLSQIAKRIHIFRVDNNVAGLNEVLTCGLIVRHVCGTANDITSIAYGSGGGANNYLWENPFLATSLFFGSGDVPIIASSFNTYATFFGNEPRGYQYGMWNNFAAQINPTAFTAWKYSCSLYSPDWIYGQVNLNYQASSDTIFDYGTPVWNATPSFGGMDCTALNSVPPSTTTGAWGTEIRLSGSTGISNDAYNDASVNLGLQQAIPLPNFAGVTSSNIAGGIFLCSGTYDGGGDPSLDTPAKIWLYTNTAIPIPSLSTTSPDMGLHYSQYYRDLGSRTAASNSANYPNNTKFGSITGGVYIPTGAYIDVTENNPSIDIYGWDTFNQKSFLKIRYPSDTSDAARGGGVTCVFVCQNRMNFNMRNPGNLAYPQTPVISSWINTPNYVATEIDNYDQGYTPRDPDVALNAYNPALPFITDMPERIIFSLVQPQNAVSNNWQIFPNLNFYDLDSAQGIITNITTLEQELVSIQQKLTARQFYNERGSINVAEPSGDTQATLGSSEPFSKPGEPIVSNRGNSNNHGLLKGVGISGETVLAFIDTISQEVIVVNQQGSIVSLNKMRSFFKNNLASVVADTPLQAPSNPYYIPITGVWDDKRKQFVWTISNINFELEAWDGIDVEYTVGNIVTYGTVFGGTPAAWICKKNNIGQEPDISPEYWKPYPQLYTIVYSIIPMTNERGERVTGGHFTTFLSPTPYFYAQWKNTYLTASPLITDNSLYEDDLGTVCSWYANNQQVNGSITFPVNDMPDVSKSYLGVWFNSQSIPYYLLFTTPSCSSYLPYTDPQWVNMNNGDAYYNSIQYDTISDPNGSPQGISGNIYGKWCTVQMTFLVGQEQYLYKAITKWKTFFRQPQN